VRQRGTDGLGAAGEHRGERQSGLNGRMRRPECLLVLALVGALSTPARAACAEGGPCRDEGGGGDVRELGETSFESFVGDHLLSCVVFFQREAPVWDAAQPIFGQLRDKVAGDERLGVAAVDMEANRRLVHRFAATGPISVKLFDRRLRSENYYDIYSLHSNGPRFRATVDGLERLLNEYITNSTGTEDLDKLAFELVAATIEGDEAQEELLFQQLEQLALGIGAGDSLNVRPAPGYLGMANGIRDRGAGHIARAYNSASLALANAARPTEFGKRITLDERTALLLQVHIVSQFSRALLHDGEPLKKHERASEATNRLVGPKVPFRATSTPSDLSAARQQSALV